MKKYASFVKQPKGQVIPATPGLMERDDMTPCDSYGREFADYITWDWADTADTPAQIAMLLDSGCSQTEIARRLGINKSTVSRYAAKLQEPAP